MADEASPYSAETRTKAKPRRCPAAAASCGGRGRRLGTPAGITGHLATKQSLVVCREALACGVKIIFTHPDWKRDWVPVDIQSELAQQGVLIEKVFRMLPPDEMCRSICEIGFDHCFVVTDRGQPGEATPMDAMVDYVSTMVGYGMGASEIQMLIRDNPARILGK